MRDLIELVSDGLSSDFFQMNYNDFIKTTIDSIPEAKYLHEEANESAEGVASEKLKLFHGHSMTNEEIRAFSALVCFKDVVVGDEKAYENFTQCQHNLIPKKPVLSKESFFEIGNYVRSKLTNPEDCAAAIWSILCNDLGKVKSIENSFNNQHPDVLIGHDAILAEVLKENAESFSAFNALPKKQQQQIIAGYTSGCDISQLEQLELPVIALNKLTSLDKETLDLYILHSIFDVAGAAAHFNSNGSFTMHQETWNFFNATQACLGTLSTTSIEDVYKQYLAYRGECVGIPLTTPESVAQIRIAGLARFGSPERGGILQAAWDTLSPEVKETLINEFNAHGGQGQRAIFIGYGVSILLNAIGAKQKEFKEATVEQRKELTRQGLVIGLTNLATAFSIARQILHERGDTSNEIFVAECDQIARALNKNPDASIGMNWRIIAQNHRRVDFAFSPKPSNALTMSQMGLLAQPISSNAFSLTDEQSLKFSK